MCCDCPVRQMSFQSVSINERKEELIETSDYHGERLIPTDIQMPRLIDSLSSLSLVHNLSLMNDTHQFFEALSFHQRSYA